MLQLSWTHVRNHPQAQPMLGAHHEFLGWRLHPKRVESRFDDLVSALFLSKHSIHNSLNGNESAYHQEKNQTRGRPLFMGIWYDEPDLQWAILCKLDSVTLVPKTRLQAIKKNKFTDIKIRETLQELFDSSSTALQLPFDRRYLDQYINT